VSGALVALGAAHAFNYASLVGRIQSELVADVVTPSTGDIGGFRIDRSGLLQEDPPTSFMGMAPKATRRLQRAQTRSAPPR
jgi:hypothetical protein